MDGLAEWAEIAEVRDARDDMRGVPFAFAIDSHLGAETGTINVLNAFRLAFWVKDRYVGRLEAPLVTEHPVVAGFARAAELMLVDFPAAAYATVLPHEIFGHGARLRELGLEASYQFLPTPPYGFDPSGTLPPPAFYAASPDERIVVLQSGIRVENFQARAILRSAVRSRRLDHIDSGLLTGIKIHEVFEASLPWESNDVREWTTILAEKTGGSAEALQTRYLIGSVVTTFTNPTLLYAAYDVGWRFLVEGERTGPLPAPTIDGVSLWFDTHVSPVPWGMEYELTALARVHGVVLEATPRVGHGPGGGSAGFAADVSEWRVLPGLVLAGGVDVWVQPEIDFDRVRLGGLGLGVLSSGPPARDRGRPGVRAYGETRFEHEGLFFGVRFGGKTRGLSGLASIQAETEATGLVGVILGPP